MLTNENTTALLRCVVPATVLVVVGLILVNAVCFYVKLFS